MVTIKTLEAQGDELPTPSSISETQKRSDWLRTTLL